MAQQLNWQDKGRMTFCSKGLPSFPDVGSDPGLYELTLDNGWVYYGQGKNLRKRLGDYCSGKTGLVQEQRLHVALRQAGGANVRIFTEGDLAENSTRCALETQVVTQARKDGRQVLNGTRAGHPYCIELDIKFYEQEIARLRGKLAKLKDQETSK